MKGRGFTVVELLVVIATVAVLSGISFAVFSSVRASAQHSACGQNLHSLGLAIHLYANDNDGWAPPATTAEDYYANKGIASGELSASPQVLVTALHSYTKNPEIWFCPVDPWKKTSVKWLGQRHRLLSYHFLPLTEGQQGQWPPRMQLGRDPLPGPEDVPLLCDAVGLPYRDSDPQFGDDHQPRSNHGDGMVNAIRRDLSLYRKSAGFFMGVRD